jgi:signal transduction histidine kinase
VFIGAAALLLASTAVARGGPPRHVLLLYSYEREFASEVFAGEFRSDLMKSSPEPIDFIEMALQPTPTSQHPTDEVIADGLRSSFDGRHLDLIVPMGGPAVQFVQRHRAELFAAAPVLLTSVDNRLVRGEALTGNETAVTVRHDLPRAIESILSVLPDTQRIVVVLGASPLEAFWVKETGSAFRPFEPRVAFTWTNDWTYEQLLDRCAHLPPHTAILYGMLLLDANGVPQREVDTLDALHAKANAPVFGLHSPQLGHGIVGGALLSIEDYSRESSAVALRLLNGEPAHAIPALALGPAAPMFDARELRRWSIAERRLQAGSIVRFREPAPVGPWVTPAIGAIGASVMGGFVAIVAFRRRGGNASGADARDSGAVDQTALARLTQRLLQAQEEERAAIARWIDDDVCQRLAALSLDLHARGDNDLRDHLTALVRESTAVSDPIYAKLTLLGLEPTSRAFTERRCTESGVALEFAASNVPDDLPRSIALPVFRVLQEALDNSLQHSGTRRITVLLRRAGDVIVLDVVDEGMGFDPAAIAPAGSLGLLTMRERLRPIGGDCVIESRVGAGTRVRAYVRVDADRAN